METSNSRRNWLPNCQFLLWLVEEVSSLWLGQITQALHLKQLALQHEHKPDAGQDVEAISDSHVSVMYILVTEAFVFISYDVWTSIHHVPGGPQSPSDRLRQGAGHRNSSDGQRLFLAHVLGGLGKEDAWEQRR